MYKSNISTYTQTISEKIKEEILPNMSFGE